MLLRNYQVKKAMLPPPILLDLKKQAIDSHYKKKKTLILRFLDNLKNKIIFFIVI